ncbi:hypothetical protein FACUT_766 [Fusarium acutatum]|uniref:Uncharacterized protein n=1 Tax=Fusarium acutatum TaxID=78861 RepID=A0A8H4K7N0_9HYPO|nr:hypothetical protein FACUT_766 [Fusarium acutatum]
MPPKAPKGGETLGGILIGGTLYAIFVAGMASLLEKTGDKKDSKEEPKQTEPNWLQRRVKEPGYYYKQVQEEFKDHHDKMKREQESKPKYRTPILELTEQDRLQAESMLKP